MLEHPLIARLYKPGIHASGTPYFVMEYVEGKPLNVFCDEQRKTFDERLTFFRSVCEAVQFAHSRAVIHLDLKPSNILVKEDGTPKLLDFGVAKQLEALNQPATQTQAVFTPAFAAPEQVRRTAVGTYTDVYALGVILFELLAGHPPFKSDCRDSTGKKVVQRLSACKKAPGATKAAWRDIDILCGRALEDDPVDRYQLVAELIQDIDHFHRNEPLMGRRHSLTYRATKFLRRNRRTILMSVAGALSLASLITFYTIRLTRARDAALLQADRIERMRDHMVNMFGGNDYDAAPPADLRVIDVLDRATKRAQKLKEDPAVQADLFEAYGNIYHNLGDLNRASTLLQAAVTLRQPINGTDQRDSAESLVALAMLRIDQAKFSESEQLARKAIAIATQNLPTTHKVLGEAMIALGAALEHQGEYREAIKILEPTVKMQTERPDESKDLLSSLTFLASSYSSLGQLAAAEPLYIRVLAEDRKLYGDRHPGVAEDLSNISDLELKRGLYAQAEQNVRQALNIELEWYRKENFEVCLLEIVLAHVLVERHKYGEAEVLLRKALGNLQRDAGPNHPFIAIGLNWSGVLALKENNLAEAQADFTRMDAIYRLLFNDDRHRVPGLQRFGELDLAQGKNAAAEQSFRELVELDSKFFGREGAQAGAAQIELGHALLLERKYAEAELQLRQGYAIVTREGDTAMESAVNASRDLAELHHLTQKSKLL